VSGEPDLIYCTWAHRALLPPPLHDRFGDLDQFVRDVISSAKSSLLILAPYLSPSGLQALKGAIGMAAKSGAWIRLVAGDLDADDGRNLRALRQLTSGSDGRVIGSRLRVLAASSELPVLIHAKSVIADGERGFLGSANMSWQGMERNFEIGVSVSGHVARRGVNPAVRSGH
jgi:phosphatidylserine/phosphatidylglycerophosphate/cardiolipin synthase-like enzyme